VPDLDHWESALNRNAQDRSKPIGARIRWLPLSVAVIALAVLCAKPGAAQEAWVMDKEVTLTLRTGAGTQYRIIGSLTTGDVVTILERGDGWTKVRSAEGKEGWVSAGFLQTSPPAQIERERLERAAEALRKQVAELSRAVEDMIGRGDEMNRSLTAESAQLQTVSAQVGASAQRAGAALRLGRSTLLVFRLGRLFFCRDTAIGAFLGVDGLLVGIGIFRHAGLELFDPLGHVTHHIGQLACPENEQDDGQDDQPLPTAWEHSIFSWLRFRPHNCGDNGRKASQGQCNPP